MPNLPTNNNYNKPSIVYKPSELLGIFAFLLAYVAFPQDYQ